MICPVGERVKCYSRLGKASGWIGKSARERSLQSTRNAAGSGTRNKSALLSTVTDGDGDKGTDYLRVQPRLSQTNSRDGKKEWNKCNFAVT